MSRLAKGSLIALAALLTLAPMAPVASAQRRAHIVVRGGGYYGGGFYGGGFYGGGYGFGWYPGWYGGGWYGPRYYYGPPAGKVKIVTEAKGNSVYVDGGFAGVTGKLKKFQLRPGAHTIEFRDPSGKTYYQERIQVLMGRTLEVRPDVPAPPRQG